MYPTEYFVKTMGNQRIHLNKHQFWRRHHIYSQTQMGYSWIGGPNGTIGEFPKIEKYEKNNGWCKISPIFWKNQMGWITTHMLNGLMWKVTEVDSDLWLLWFPWCLAFERCLSDLQNLMWRANLGSQTKLHQGALGISKMLKMDQYFSGESSSRIMKRIYMYIIYTYK